MQAHWEGEHCAEQRQLRRQRKDERMQHALQRRSLVRTPRSDDEEQGDGHADGDNDNETSAALGARLHPDLILAAAALDEDELLQSTGAFPHNR